MFAGPGAGKSTLATGVFSQLKKIGVNCEYVHEEAKEFTWEKREVTLACQPYIFAKQMRNLWRLKDQVDVVITDSPILLSMIYTNTNEWPDSFLPYVLDQFNAFDNLNFLIPRAKKYNPVGRNQTLEEAVEKDKEIRQVLLDNNIEHVIIKSTAFNYGECQAVGEILEKIEKSS